MSSRRFTDSGEAIRSWCIVRSMRFTNEAARWRCSGAPGDRAPPLVRYLNTVFTAAFNRDGIDRAHVELAPEREETHGAPAVVRWTLPNATEQADALAGAIAELIESHHAVNDPETARDACCELRGCRGARRNQRPCGDNRGRVARTPRTHENDALRPSRGSRGVPREGLSASPRRSLGYPRHGRDPGAQRIRGAGAVARRSAAVARGRRGRPALGRRRRPDRLAHSAITQAIGYALSC